MTEQEQINYEITLSSLQMKAEDAYERAEEAALDVYFFERSGEPSDAAYTLAAETPLKPTASGTTASWPRSLSYKTAFKPCSKWEIRFHHDGKGEA